MRKIIQIIKKDILLLLRDKTGLSFLFGMPVVLVLIMTLLQDSTLKALQEEQFDIIVINNDSDIIGDAIIAGLNQAPIFKTHYLHNNEVPTCQEAKQLVVDGVFKMGLIIPENCTAKFTNIVSNEINKQIADQDKATIDLSLGTNKSELSVFFDPVIKASFKQALSGSLREIIANIQSHMIFKSYTTLVEKLNQKKNTDMIPLDNFSLVEEAVGNHKEAKLPNSTQHNVPAWTIFAIFFIVIPISGQMISERDSGTSTRLKTIPTQYITHLFSKIIVYTNIALLQLLVLLFIGKYILPLLGLPELTYNSFSSVICITLIIGLAATCYAIAVGTIAKTHNQASVFGSISIVILAAIGGLWVPTFMMTDTMLFISDLSPLNWALSAYSKLFLQGKEIVVLAPEIIKLLSFSMASVAIASIYEKIKSNNL